MSPYVHVRAPRFSTDDVSDIRAFNRIGWDRLKAEGIATPARMAQSLQSLRDQNYTLDDISLMFGVSRERVHQWCHKYRVTMLGNGGLGRFWDDDLGRFVARGYVEVNAEAARLRRVERKEMLVRRRRICVALLQSMRPQTRSGIPGVNMLALVVKPKARNCSSDLLNYLGVPPLNRQYRRITTELWAEAGWPPPPRGRPSHYRS